ncbi:MAG: hypothetical protein OES09_10640 [Gammaproteobacteria bacterium]|nr:hypothetical protein [Gammaproteobacteria bacterium]
MAGAVPIVGAVITSYVVSEAVRAIGPAIGLSDDLTNLLGTVAGAYAGGAAYNAATAAPAAPVPDLSASPGNIPGTPLAPSAAPPVSNIAGTPLAPAGSPYASAPSAGATRGGMLSEPPTVSTPARAATTAQAPGTRPSPGTDTAGRIIEAETVTPASTGGTQTSWLERLFSSDKTMDLVMAGMQGYGQAGIVQEQMEYPERIARENAADWAAAYPGQKSIRSNFPTQGGG